MIAHDAPAVPLHIYIADSASSFLKTLLRSAISADGTPPVAPRRLGEGHINAHKRRMKGTLKRYEAPPRHHHSHCIAFCCRTLLASSLIFLPWSRTVHLPLSLYLSRSLYPSFHLLSLLQSFFVFLHRITLKLLSHEGSMMRPECCRSERSRTRTRKAAWRGRPSSKSSPSQPRSHAASDTGK